MLVILYQRGCKTVAHSMAADLRGAFSDRVPIQLIAAEAATPLSAAVAWDDLLVVVYSKADFPDAGNILIAAYLQARPRGGMLLPVAVSTNRRPPKAAEAIKALEFDASARGRKGRLVTRAGSMLGLRLQGRDAKIFISYRATDGKEIANQLFGYLKELGYQPWLDQAKDNDGDTAILPGRPVQAEIDLALNDASLVLLIDTKEAPNSRYIRDEVNTADALLVPILPVCFREASDPTIGPRFTSLRALQRWVTLQMPPSGATAPLSNSDLQMIAQDSEGYLCEIFVRKCRVPFIVEQTFLSHGFAWKELDKRLLMYESTKQYGPRLKTTILSHCSIFQQVYGPALKRFRKFLVDTGRPNYSLFVYDGELLPEADLEELAQEHPDQPVLLLHHQELAALIQSNFTVLGTP